MVAKSWPNKPYYNAFYSQRHSALNIRGIEWLLSFEEWLKIWVDSGHLPNRGRKKGQYCMARFGDKGPYAVGNVKIITVTENVQEGTIGREFSEQHRKGISNANYRRYESQAARDRVSLSNKTRGVSEATKQKISNKLKGRKLTEEHKRNIQIGMGRNPK